MRFVLPRDSRRRVFVASTSVDLGPYRAAARDAILEVGWTPDMMEYIGASARPTVQGCLDRVTRADLIVLILAYRLGWVPTVAEGGDGRSTITMLEYHAALSAGRPALVFLADSSWPPELREADSRHLQRIVETREAIDRPARFFCYELGAGQTGETPGFRNLVRFELQRYRETLPRISLFGILLLTIMSCGLAVLATHLVLDRRKRAEDTSRLLAIISSGSDRGESLYAIYTLIADYRFSPSSLRLTLSSRDPFDVAEIFGEGVWALPPASAGTITATAVRAVHEEYIAEPDVLGALFSSLDVAAERCPPQAAGLASLREELVTLFTARKGAPPLAESSFVTIPGYHDMFGRIYSPFEITRRRISAVQFSKVDSSYAAAPDEWPARGSSWYSAYAYASLVNGRLPTYGELTHALGSDSLVVCDQEEDDSYTEWVLESYDADRSSALQHDILMRGKTGLHRASLNASCFADTLDIVEAPEWIPAEVRWFSTGFRVVRTARDSDGTGEDGK